MPIFLTKEPTATAPIGSAGRWNAVHNPIIFEFQRKDTLITTIRDNGSGNIRVNVVYSILDAKVGQKIYMSAPGPYTGVFTIKAINQFPMYLDLNEAFNGNTAGGFVNLTEARTNYHVFMNLFKYTGPGTQGDDIATAKFFDRPDGSISADISEYLKTQLKLTTNYDFFGVNKMYPDLDVTYGMTFRQGFISETIEPELETLTELADQHWATKSAKQLGDIYGNNMRRYTTEVPVDPPASVEEHLTLFMDEFEVPTFFDGYPFALSIIYSDKNTTKYVDRSLQQVDVNGNQLAIATEHLLHTHKKHINAITLRGVVFNADTQCFNLSLEESDSVINDGWDGTTGGGTGSGNLPDGYMADDYVDVSEEPL